MAAAQTKQPYDAELILALSQIPMPPNITKEMLPMLRLGLGQHATAAATLAVFPSLLHEERTIDGPHGEIVLSIFRPKDSTASKSPGVVWIHGGGMVMGNRFAGISCPAEWVEKFGVVCVSVDYRLAPEHPDPAPLDDCYTALKWVGDNLETLGIDPTKLMLAGQSGGGGLAAGTALLVRDRGGPALCAQLLACPMLDNRGDTASAKLYHDGAVWSAATNSMAWGCVLNGNEEPSIYTAPARATDLSGLPPAYIDVGSAEMFRDEDVAYATLLWASGVPADLHVWAGGYHGFDMLAPSTTLARAAIATRTAWVGRIFGVDSSL